ncbi:MAG TPA: monovalent cation/H(+) antiporter subunit G [Oleiagrimonas sp.]|nr:monovalent cation/H(+) antiporter subunit G [Oleiagrimonas sp.]
MSALVSLPDWAALLVAALVLASALLAFIGSIGLLRLKSFYSRLHAPTLGTTLGLFLMVVATVLCFSLARGRLVLGPILIGIFVTATVPITMILLARAALQRDRSEGDPRVPPAPSKDPRTR